MTIGRIGIGRIMNRSMAHRRLGALPRAGWWRALLACLLVMWSLAVSAEEPEALPPVDLNPEQAALAGAVKGEVMAPCCWHGTVDHHNSPLARQLATRIDGWAASGKDQKAMLDLLVAEYGERILARPRREGFGMWFYAGPTVLVGAAGLLLSRWLKRQTSKAAGTLGGAADLSGQAVGISGARPGGSSSGEGLEREFEAELKRLDG